MSNDIKNKLNLDCNVECNIWDLDCNSNMMNDICDKYSFAEDRGDMYSPTAPFKGNTQ